MELICLCVLNTCQIKNLKSGIRMLSLKEGMVVCSSRAGTYKILSVYAQSHQRQRNIGNLFLPSLDILSRWEIMKVSKGPREERLGTRFPTSWREWHQIDEAAEKLVLGSATEETDMATRASMNRIPWALWDCITRVRRKKRVGWENLNLSLQTFAAFQVHLHSQKWCGGKWVAWKEDFLPVFSLSLFPGNFLENN